MIPTKDRGMAFELMLMEEVEELTRQPLDTLRYWRHVGKGPRSFKLGNRVVYKREDVERWIEAQYSADHTAGQRVG
jgi:predicted DNA-binding transcriptional regulator AlpA